MLRYARTAHTAAQNAGRVQAMEQQKEIGIKVQKRWIATLDRRTRDSHAYLDGQIVDVDQPFQSLLGEIMYPGDPNAEPGDVWNCRCTLGYVYPEYPANAQRRDNETGEVTGYKTYQEWKESKESALKNSAAQIIIEPKSKESSELNLQLFAERDIKNQTETSIKRGIESLNERISEHLKKIEHPEDTAGWDELSEERKTGLLRHWEKEINNFRESIQNREKELEQRRKTNDTEK